MSTTSPTARRTRALPDDDARATRARHPLARVTRPLTRLALPMIFLVLVAVFSILAPQTFPTVDTARTVLASQSVLAILALSAFVTLYIGEFDLSIGYQLGLAAILVPGLAANQGLSLGAAVAVALAACTAVGLVNGALTALLGLNSFVVTIAVGALLGGFILWYSGGAPIFEGVPASLLDLSGSVLAIPLPIIYVLVLAAVLWFLVHRTVFGRHMAALGGSKPAARLSGVNTTRVQILAFGLAGLLAGCAGVITAGQLGTGNPAVGPGYLLPAFAAAFLGTTSFHVGRFNIWGTLAAVVTIATGVAGLNLIGVPQWVDPVFNGTALLVAIIATRYLTAAKQP